MAHLKSLRMTTHGSTQMRKRFVLTLLALLSAITIFVAVFCILSDISLGQEPIIGGGNTNGFYSFKTSTETSPTPTPTPSIDSNNNSNNTPPTQMFVVPEYGLGGGLFALFTCFVAFTLFMRYKKNQK